VCWEYKRKQITAVSYADLIVQLNLEGNDGWEIVDYTEGKESRRIYAIVLFKRVITKL
jgi:hypothetical protein